MQLINLRCRKPNKLYLNCSLAYVKSASGLYCRHLQNLLQNFVSHTHPHRCGLTDNPMCPCKEEEETTDHLIFQCQKLSNQRNEMVKQIKKHWLQLAYDERNTRK